MCWPPWFLHYGPQHLFPPEFSKIQKVVNCRFLVTETKTSPLEFLYFLLCFACGTGGLSWTVMAQASVYNGVGVYAAPGAHLWSSFFFRERESRVWVDRWSSGQHVGTLSHSVMTEKLPACFQRWAGVFPDASQAHWPLSDCLPFTWYGNAGGVAKKIDHILISTWWRIL